MKRKARKKQPARKKPRRGRKGSQAGATGLVGKPVQASQSEMVEVVLPNHANPLGNILGGRVMHLIDIAAAIACHRHCNSYAATASVDHVDFRTPIKVGHLIVLKSSVNRTFRTSLEVGVKVFGEHILTGERQHTSSAYVTFVAVNKKTQPQPVAPVIPETPEEWRRYHEAAVRRKLRLAQRRKKPSR
jgi:acyl-CoA hydrolase